MSGIGRFTGKDPYLLNNYNNYSYCLNNPILNIDFSGKFVAGVRIQLQVKGAIVSLNYGPILLIGTGGLRFGLETNSGEFNSKDNLEIGAEATLMFALCFGSGHVDNYIKTDESTINEIGGFGVMVPVHSKFGVGLDFEQINSTDKGAPSMTNIGLTFGISTPIEGHHTQSCTFGVGGIDSN